MENNENLNKQVNNDQVEKKTNSKTIGIVLLIIGLLLMGVAVYKLFVEKPKLDNPKDDNKQEQVNINYEILNYQCEGYCAGKDYINIRQLLNTYDTVKYLLRGKDNKIHGVVLESVDKGNEYLYLVDKDKYYFKNENYYNVSFIAEQKSAQSYDYDYAIVHQKFTSPNGNNNDYTANSKIYSFKDKDYLINTDGYYECTYVEYENEHFYRLSRSGYGILYDSKFNKLIDETTHDEFALDGKYVFGVIEKDSEYKFYRYNIAEGKYELSKVQLDYGDLQWTYNYIVVNTDDYEFEVYDFDGNKIFKTNEQEFYKSINTDEYSLPSIPNVYYSKAENKIRLVIVSDSCGDESCPRHYGTSYYEYDISSKEIKYKFYTDLLPDNFYENIYDGYAKFSY